MKPEEILKKMDEEDEENPKDIFELKAEIEKNYQK